MLVSACPGSGVKPRDHGSLGRQARRSCVVPRARPTDGKDDGAAAVSESWRRLTDGLITRERQGRLTNVTLLDESGTGDDYTYPSGRGRGRYFKLSEEFWTGEERWYRTLTLLAKVSVDIGDPEPRSSRSTPGATDRRGLVRQGIRRLTERDPAWSAQGSSSAGGSGAVTGARAMDPANVATGSTSASSSRGESSSALRTVIPAWARSGLRRWRARWPSGASE